MKKIITNLFIAIFVAQFFISGLDGINEESQPISADHEQIVKFTGRQSSGMNGTTADCNFTNIADGLGGPVWQNGSTYVLGAIVEWPAHSGQFYQTILNTSSSPEDGPDHWIGPCTCSEISEASNMVWDSSINYDAWQIVEHNGSIWIAQDAGAPSGEEPGDEDTSAGMSSSSFWVPCTDRSPCSSFNGQGGSVWQSNATYSLNETVEWPANSGQYWQSTASGPTVEPDINGKWIGPCSCKDIWSANSSETWDSNLIYNAGMIVEFPAGSEDIWVAISPSTTAGVDPTYPWADGNEWELCSSDDSQSGGPCDGATVVGVWDSSINVTSGEVYEYPANSQMYYQVNPGSPFWSVSAPDIDADVWTPCEDNPPASGGPCDVSTVVGVWDNTTAPAIGDLYEFPANSGNHYQIIFIHSGLNGGPGWIADPVVNGGLDEFWTPCEDNPPASGGPCAGLDSVGVWSANTTAIVGEIYQYPANSGEYYEVIYTDSNGLISTAPGDAQDYEFWIVASCPCEETWITNGEPVWDSTISFYAGNYVVEWPAGSGKLYISESGGITSAGEPGIDIHWIPCDDSTTTTVDEPEEVEGWLPSVGVFGTVVAITMSVFVFGRDRQN